MRKIFQAFDSFSEKFGKVVSFIVWIGAIILFIEVFLRYFFNAPTVWAHGYTQRFFGSYFVLIGAFITNEKAFLGKANRPGDAFLNYERIYAI